MNKQQQKLSIDRLFGSSKGIKEHIGKQVRVFGESRWYEEGQTGELIHFDATGDPWVLFSEDTTALCVRGYEVIE